MGGVELEVESESAMERCSGKSRITPFNQSNQDPRQEGLQAMWKLLCKDVRGIGCFFVVLFFPCI